MDNFTGLRTFFTALSMLMLLTGCAPRTHVPTASHGAIDAEASAQNKMVIKHQVAQMQRLQNVAYPILSRNDVLCGKEVKPYYGFYTVTQSALPKRDKEAYASLYGITEQPTVFMTVKGSPAAAKLRIGDEIVAIGGQAIKSGSAGQRAFENAALSADMLRLTVKRGSKKVDVNVKPDRVCGYDVVLVPGQQINAYADGSKIYMTSAMLDFIDSDNQLALIVGHELAHNTREHIASKRGNALIGALIGAVITVGTGVDVTNTFAEVGAGAYSQSFEAEADYVGLYHTARAGYNIHEAPKFFRKLSLANPAAIHASSSHPSNAERFVVLEHVVAEIQKKKRSGQPLIPNEAEAPKKAPSKPNQ